MTVHTGSLLTPAERRAIHRAWFDCGPPLSGSRGLLLAGLPGWIQARLKSRDSIGEQFWDDLTRLAEMPTITDHGEPPVATFLHNAARLVSDRPERSVFEEMAAHAVQRSARAPLASISQFEPQSTELRRRLIETVDGYLQSARAQAILGKLFDRPELTSAIDVIEGGPRQVLLITGEPGAGKTSVVAQLIEHFVREDWPVLAFRMDRLRPEPSARALGEQLGLDASPTDTLLQTAEGAPCLLAVDQLDAVSEISGRNTDFLERASEVAAATRLWPNLRVVLGCRTFDAEGDHRIYGLLGPHGIAERLHIGRLEPELVCSVVERDGAETAQANPRLLDLLSLPFNLRLWTTLPRNDKGQRVGDAGELLAAHWRRTARALRSRLAQERWQALLDSALDEMGAHRSMSVPRTLLEDIDDEALEALLAVGLLACDGAHEQRVFFPHEILFDYAFARRFVSRGRDLTTYLIADDQPLSIRTTVRQVLEHEREVRFERYLQTLGHLLRHARVRFHIKHMVLAWLRHVRSPTLQEWQLLQTLTTDATDGLERAIDGVRYSVSWFDLLDERGWIDEALANETDRADDAVGYLGWASRVRPERVARRVHTWLKRGAPWFDRALQVMQKAELHETETWVGVLTVACERNSAAVVTGLASYRYHCLRRVPEAWPDKACRIAASVLSDSLIEWWSQVRASGIRGMWPHPELATGLGDTWWWYGLARRAPRAYVESVLPIALETVRVNVSARQTIRPGDLTWRWWQLQPPAPSAFTYDWVFGWPRKAGGLESDMLLGSLSDALDRLSTLDPAAWEAALDLLVQHIHLHTGAFLLLKALTHVGQNQADRAVRLLLDRPNLLAVRYSSASYWVARELIAATAPYCSDALYRQLESMLLSYFGPDDRELRRWDREYRPHTRSFGRAQLTLLNGLPPQRRSATVHRRLGELGRRFGRSDAEGPPVDETIRIDPIGPPFDGAWDRMTDAHWLAAFRVHTQDEAWRINADQHRGGALELARPLRERAEAEPTRFARLLIHLPEDVSATYRRAILSGLERAASDGRFPDTRTLWDLLRALDDDTIEPSSMDHWGLLRHGAHLDVPADIIDRLLSHAKVGSGARDTLEDEHEDDLFPTMTRLQEDEIRTGAVCEVLRALLFARPPRLHSLRKTIERLVRADSVAVRTQVAGVLLPVLNLDRQVAIDLFCTLTDSPDPRVATCRSSYRFITYTRRQHWDRLEPLIDRMLAADCPRAHRQASRHISALALGGHRSTERLDQLWAGPPTMREEVVAIAARSVVESPSDLRAQQFLVAGFDDPSPLVVKAAVRFLEHIRRADEPPSLIRLEAVLEAFVRSPAFETDQRDLIWALEESPARLPDITLLVYERLLTSSSRTYFQTKLLHRLYRDTSSADVKRRCLDIIDQLLARGGVPLDELLEDHS